MTLCKPVIGSRVTVAIIPNSQCLKNPKVERVILTAAAALDATTISVSLDPSYVPGAYTATSKRNLFANTLLFFGAGLTPVRVLEDYVLDLTAQTISVAPVSAPIAANATADSYLAGRLCLNSKTINANAQTGAANEDCDTGALLKNVITGVVRDMALTGQIQTSRSFWLLLQRLGSETETGFFYQDLNRVYGAYGTLQLGPVTETNASVGSVVEFQSTAQIFSYAQHYPASMVGAVDPLTPDTVVLSASQKAANDVVRRLWGYDTIQAV
jgi:hypothetical protein